MSPALAVELRMSAAMIATPNAIRIPIRATDVATPPSIAEVLSLSPRRGLLHHPNGCFARVPIPRLSEPSGSCGVDLLSGDVHCGQHHSPFASPRPGRAARHRGVAGTAASAPGTTGALVAGRLHGGLRGRRHRARCLPPFGASSGGSHRPDPDRG